MTTLWNYASWISEDDPTERLRLLRLHIAEVTNRTVGIEGRSQNVTAVDGKYLQRLLDKEDQLKMEASGSCFASNPIEFRRL